MTSRMQTVLDRLRAAGSVLAGKETADREVVAVAGKGDQVIEWYREAGTPDAGIFWWAIEHQGHPAFFARALMPGDFAPGRGPLPRHLAGLDGAAVAEARCGLCDEVPAPGDLEAIERNTGNRGFLAPYRTGRVRWPAATDPASCWQCSSRKEPATATAELGGGTAVAVCEKCAAHLAHGRR